LSVNGAQQDRINGGTTNNNFYAALRGEVRRLSHLGEHVTTTPHTCVGGTSSYAEIYLFSLQR